MKIAELLPLKVNAFTLGDCKINLYRLYEMCMSCLGLFGSCSP